MLKETLGGTTLRRITTRVVPPDYVAEIEADPSNPLFIAYQIFQGRNYNLKFLSEGTKLKVLCSDQLQRNDLKLRIGIIRKHPDFRFLYEAFDANRNLFMLEPLEKIASGDRTNLEVQKFIPDAELISLEEPDLRAGLALHTVVENIGLKNTYLKLDN